MLLVSFVYTLHWRLCYTYRCFLLYFHLHSVFNAMFDSWSMMPLGLLLIVDDDMENPLK